MYSCYRNITAYAYSIFLGLLQYLKKKATQKLHNRPPKGRFFYKINKFPVG